MVRRMFFNRLYLTLIVWLTGFAEVQAGLVVNELMVNEPGGATNYEWIELYADTLENVMLTDYELLVEGASVVLPSGILMAPHSYLVICRKLVSGNGSASFEQRWGDNSGIWGDTPAENALVAPIEGSFSLINSGGSVEILHGNLIVSTFRWNDPGLDGRSWERVVSSSNNILQSVDFDGSTPGFINSVTPVEHDLGLESLVCTVEQGITSIRFVIINRGLNLSSLSTLTVHPGETGYSEPLYTIDIHPLDPLDSVTPVMEYTFTDSMYVVLSASLPEDDRERNNHRAFIAPGEDFPPFVLTEAAPRPGGSSDAEWIEVVNRTDREFDLTGWQIGDYKQTNVISDGSLLVPYGTHVVLTRSAPLFRDLYPEFDGLLTEPERWAALNDGGDTIILKDNYGLVASRFAYDDLFEDDHTWAVVESGIHAGQWGRSENPGGSPGETNQVMVTGSESQLKVVVSPEVFSPDGDGVEDSVLISIDGPDVTAYQLKIFDRNGRIVRQFDHVTYRNANYTWDGRSDSGSRLPIGIYILFCEIDGAGSVRKPIVIAR